MLPRISASASPVSMEAWRSAMVNNGGSGFFGLTCAVGMVSVSRRSSLIDSSRRQLFHGSRGDRTMELPLEDGIDDEDGHDGDHDGGEQPAEVDVVVGL